MLTQQSDSFITRDFAFILIACVNICQGFPLPQGGAGSLPNSPLPPVQPGSQVQPIQPSSASGQQALPVPPNLPAQPGGVVQPQPSSTTSLNSSVNSGATTKKPNSLSQGVFNSWLCGAGYVYNLVTKMCMAQTGFSRDDIFSNSSSKPAAQAAASANAGTGTGAQANAIAMSSDETAEYVQPEEESIRSFFPLECGMNYRYLKRAKICKPKNAPVSSESDENQMTLDSSED